MASNTEAPKTPKGKLRESAGKIPATPSTPQSKGQRIDEQEGFTTPQKAEPGDMEGYLVNVTSPSNNSRFNFLVQGKRRSLQYVCFEPERKKQMTELLGSPVKISKTRGSSKSSDLTFTRDSQITPVDEMDFPKLDMENLTINQLSTLPFECVVSITGKVTSRSKEMETHSGLPYQVLSVCDESAAIKVLLWGEEFINMLDEGKSYRFKNMRIKEDKKYGGISLGTTKSDDTEITLSVDLGAVVEGELHLTVGDTMIGSILMVNKQMIDYISCKKCTKKIEGDTSGPIVFCQTCDSDVLAAKCKLTRVVKIEFEDDTEKLHHFTIFSNVLDKALEISSASMNQPDLRLHLLNLPRMEIIHARKIIQSLKLIE